MVKNIIVTTFMVNVAICG